MSNWNVKQYSKKGEMKQYKMISSAVGHVFNFTTDDAEKFHKEFISYHNKSTKDYTYELIG